MSTTPTQPVRPQDPLAGLLVASGAGDEHAFAQLFDAIAPRVFGLVLRVLRDRQQSEEVAQEVLLEVWQSASRFDPNRGSGQAWVLTMAHRRAVDRVRSSDAARRRDITHSQRNVAVPFDETAEAALGSDAATRVRRALDQLSPMQAEAVRLSYFGGYTHSEVSSLLQIPVGTAKSRIRDGLIKLRDLLVPAVEVA